MPNPITKPCVYCITNVVTERRYVGSTSKFSGRKRQHLYGLRHGNHYSSLMQSDYNAYGEDSFKFYILEDVETFDRTFLFEREQHWMDKYKPEYNNNDKAGDVFPSWIYTDDWRESLRKRMTGRKQSQEERNKRSESLKSFYKNNTKVVTPEQREKLRLANLGEKNPNWGKHFTAERSKNHSDGLSYVEYTFQSPDGEVITFKNLTNPRTDRDDLPPYTILRSVEKFAKCGKIHSSGWKFISKMRKSRND